MCVCRNGGQERMHGVDKMDAEGNSQERRENWEFGRRRDLGGVNDGRKDQGFGLGTI